MKEQKYYDVMFKKDGELMVERFAANDSGEALAKCLTEDPWREVIDCYRQNGPFIPE